MKFLEDLSPGTPDTIYWCFYSKENRREAYLNNVPSRVKALIEKKRGVLVPIDGFDEMMFWLYKRLKESLNIPDLKECLDARTKKRVDDYDEQWCRLSSQAVEKPSSESDDEPNKPEEAKDTELAQAATELAGQRKEKPWWLEAEEQTDPDKKDAIYQKAIQAMPTSAPLLGNYALFLNNEREDYDRAEEFFMRAIDADPKHANNLANYASFLKNARKDYDRAEEYYDRAIDADPKHAINLGNYALFLSNDRKDYDRAEEYYKHAIDADPKGANNLGNYAQLLFIKGRDDEAKVKLFEAEACMSTNNNTGRVELLFYRLAHLPEAWPAELGRMKSLLTKGARSLGWNLSGNVQRAEQSGHPNIRLLEQIARVISDDAPLALLDEFSEWKEAIAADS